ncbi:MAG: hypothetical protein AB7N76_07990 [Planctomycetota bacterium]
MIRLLGLMLLCLSTAGCPGQRRMDPRIQADVERRAREAEEARRQQAPPPTPSPSAAPAPATPAERLQALATEVAALEAALGAPGAKDWQAKDWKALLERCEVARRDVAGIQERALEREDQVTDDAALGLLERLQVVRARIVERR